MKTTSIIAYATLIIVGAYVARGQSSFWLSNANGPVIAPVFDAQGVRLDGSNYAVELWGSATPDSLTPAIGYYSRQRVILAFMSSGSAGYFRDSYEGRNSLDHPTILGVAPYVGMAWLQVRAWDARLGATYEEVVARGLGGYGESPLFSATGSSPLDLLGSPAPLIGLQSFSLRPGVPEPSTVALVLVGLPFLLLHRCCKQN